MVLTIQKIRYYNKHVIIAERKKSYVSAKEHSAQTGAVFSAL